MPVVVTIYSQIAPLIANRTTRLDKLTGQYYLDINCPQDGALAPAVCKGWVGPSGAAQIFFDDPRSLPAKYELAAKLGIRGVGPYDLEDLAAGCTWVRCLAVCFDQSCVDVLILLRR